VPFRSDAVAIVVLHRDDPAATRRCLESLSRIADVPHEVILVDNGSTDGSGESLRRSFPEIHVIREETNLGVAGGRNRGIAKARELPHGRLFFLDNDAWVEPDALGHMVRVMSAQPGVGLVVPKCYRPTTPPVFASAGGHRVNWFIGTIRSVGAGERDRGQYDDWRPLTCSGGVMLVDRRVVERVGGFDEVFNPYGWEDLDFSLRARQAGFDIRLAPEALVYHAGGKAGRGPRPEYERSKTRGYFVLMRRHASRLQWACFVSLLPLRGIRRVIREILRGRPSIVAAHLRGALGRKS
jgi:GT2 family glycosyltransferase